MISSQDNLFPYENTHIQLDISLQSTPKYNLLLYDRPHISGIPGSCLLMYFFAFGSVLSTFGHTFDESRSEDGVCSLVMTPSQMAFLSH